MLPDEAGGWGMLARNAREAESVPGTKGAGTVINFCAVTPVNRIHMSLIHA